MNEPSDDIRWISLLEIVYTEDDSTAGGDFVGNDNIHRVIYRLEKPDLWYIKINELLHTNGFTADQKATLAAWGKKGVRFYGNGWMSVDLIAIAKIFQAYENKVANGAHKLGLGLADERKLFFLKANDTISLGGNYFAPRGQHRYDACLTEPQQIINSPFDAIIFGTNSIDTMVENLAHELGHAFDFNYVNVGFRNNSTKFMEWIKITGWQQDERGDWVCPDNEPNSAGAPTDYAIKDKIRSPGAAPSQLEAPLGDFADSFGFYLLGDMPTTRSYNPLSRQRKLDPNGGRAMFIKKQSEN